MANHLQADPIGPLPAQPDLNRHGEMHRSLDPIYAFPEKRFVKNLVDDMPHRTSALRCLGGARNNFVLESFMEELGHAQSWILWSTGFLNCRTRGRLPCSAISRTALGRCPWRRA